MRFGVLGPLAVWTDTGAPVPVPGFKVRALLADLLAHQGRPVSTDRLIEDLWGAAAPANPAGALQVRVSQLRRALDEAEPGARDLVLSRPPGYLLAVAPDAVDAGRFARMAEQARRSQDPQARAALLDEALTLWRGPAFADFGDEEFTRAAVTRLAEQRLVVLEEQAEARLELGEHTVLAGELNDLVARYPLRERLRAAQLRALYGAGRQSEALDSYTDLRTRLADELGLDPSPELVALYQAILRQDPSLTTAAVARATATQAEAARADRPRTNLPVPLTELVGRDRAVAEIRALLAAGRLVTLTGSGGVGKTRLALETARQLVDAYPDGVWLVELTGLERSGLERSGLERSGGDVAGTDGGGADGGGADGGGADGGRNIVGENVAGADVTGLVAAVLDIRDPADRLVAALRARELLLVLDNCEHVVEAAAGAAERLLRAAPGLRILATSRQPLGLAGEVLWDVPPLAVPGDEGTDIERSPAVRLFAARATAAARSFVLDADTAPAVALLCRRLDGIPLALELAATRVRALGIHGVVDRLDDRFRLLASGPRDAPARQRTLTATLDWSWDLLTGPERAVLRRLAVPVDGCSLDAAETICAGAGVPATEVLDLLACLVDRSLVVLDNRTGDGPRYRLLESVAAYCLDRIAEAGELPAVRDRHARYYTELAERAEPYLYGPEQRTWLRRLDPEAANLRAALDTAIRAGAADQALRLGCALLWYRFLRGRLTEARRSLAAALSAANTARSAGRPVTLEYIRRAATWQAGIALLQGDTTLRQGDTAPRQDGTAQPEAAGQAGQIADPAVRARAWWFLGFAMLDHGDPAASAELLDRALESAGEIGDRWVTAATLSTRAKVAHIRGDLAGLERDAERSAALFTEIGDRWGLLQATEWLGGLAELTGDYERATTLHRDGLRMAEELGLWLDAANRLSWLGWVAMQLGDHQRAREHAEQALRLATEQGFRTGEVFAELVLGFAARRDGKLDVAEAHLCNLLAYARQDDAGGHPPAYLPMVLGELGFVAELRGDAAAALAQQLDAFATAQRLDAPRDIAFALEGLAAATVLAGRPGQAAQLLGAAAAARQATGVPPAPVERDDIDRTAAATRAALGEAAYAAAFDRGTALTPDEARSLIEPRHDTEPRPDTEPRHDTAVTSRPAGRTQSPRRT